VIPTILVTLGVAWWFRSSNRRARYLPNFDYSGRLEMLVWSIPAMTVLLVGGVAWVGSHDLDPRKLLSSTVKPIRVQVVSLDWKWLFIYPDQGIATVNQLTIPVGTPVSFELTSSGGDGFADMRFNVEAVPAEGFARWVAATRSAGPVLDAQAYSDLAQAESGGCAIHLSCRRSQPVQRHLERRNAAGRSIATHSSGITEGGKMNLLGKLSWEAITFDQPIVMAATAGMIAAIVSSFLGGSRSRDTCLTCGASGSRPSTISASASCTSCWR
jgi:hypothetical protein